MASKIVTVKIVEYRFKVFDADSDDDAMRQAEADTWNGDHSWFLSDEPVSTSEIESVTDAE